MRPIARVVVPQLPHHVTRRGSNRQDVFFTDDDRYAEQYPWSNAAAHCIGRDSRRVVNAAEWARKHPPELWRQILREPQGERVFDGLRCATRAGRPLASDAMIAKLEARLGRRLRPLPRGRPRKDAAAHGKVELPPPRPVDDDQ